MSTPVSTLGIDAGASLCKLAFLNQRLETALLPSNETAAVRERIERWAPRRVVATGGGTPLPPQATAANFGKLASTLTDNPLPQQMLGLVASLQGRETHFLSDAPLCRAVSAAALADA